MVGDAFAVGDVEAEPAGAFCGFQAGEEVEEGDGGDGLRVGLRGKVELFEGWQILVVNRIEVGVWRVLPEDTDQGFCSGFSVVWALASLLTVGLGGLFGGVPPLWAGVNVDIVSFCRVVRSSIEASGEKTGR